MASSCFLYLINQLETNIIWAMQDSKITLIKDWLGNGAINILGKPLSGKDIQCQSLATIFNGQVIGGGNLLRQSNELSDNDKRALQAGYLIDSSKYLQLILPAIKNPDYSNQPLFLSSVGRKNIEEEAIFQALIDSSHKLKLVIYLEVSDKTVLERQSRHRADDTTNVLQNRLRQFQEQTLPVINFLQEKKILITINGERPPEIVTQNIIDALVKKANHA